MFAPIAQLVEQLPFKEKVTGSNPVGRTRRTLKRSGYMQRDMQREFLFISIRPEAARKRIERIRRILRVLKG